jgi:hypothetical protein
MHIELQTKEKTMKTINTLKTMLMGVIAVSILGAATYGWCEEEAPEVEDVFLLDTTGSMGGLLDGAKEKIWSVANQIVKGAPQPELRVGLVAYRDRGDDYITQVFDLTDDLDSVYDDLTSFQAGGGGDGPEHVSQGMVTAIEDISWSDDPNVLRILFLVGDAPPHVDYDDGYDYAEACEAAVRMDIVINTIQCGANAQTTRYWTEIASLGEGEFAAIAQSGGMVAVATPHDDEIGRLSREVEGTAIAWGDEENRARKNRASDIASEMAPSSVAERGAFKSETGRLGSYDLIDALDAGTVELNELEGAQLPEAWRDLDEAQVQEKINDTRIQREKLQKEIKALSVKRDGFVRKTLEERGTKDGFDAKVLKMLRAQSEKKGITY